jgi:hypothetical protein
MEVLLVWTVGFILNGAPHTRRLQNLPPMTMEECTLILHTDTDRMKDWVRGKIGAPLNSPIAVYGECHPVLKDATQRAD